METRLSRYQSVTGRFIVYAVFDTAPGYVG